jgi:hypothetical protein
VWFGLRLLRLRGVVGQVKRITSSKNLNILVFVLQSDFNKKLGFLLSVVMRLLSQPRFALFAFDRAAKNDKQPSEEACQGHRTWQLPVRFALPW